MRHTINRQKVVLEHFDDETILINMQTCVYYSLNRSGCEVWKLVEAGHDATAIVAALASRHASDAATVLPQVEALLSELVQEGLLDPEPGPGPGPGPAPAPAVETPQAPPILNGATGPFEAPRLSRYHDMQDLLLLDPIHDVDESGWPNARPQALAGGK